MVYLLTVRDIPKFKDRANWSRDTFQPMRRRACVYQQTNQNIAPVIKNFQNDSSVNLAAKTKFGGCCLTNEMLFLFACVFFNIYRRLAVTRISVKMTLLCLWQLI